MTVPRGLRWLALACVAAFAVFGILIPVVAVLSRARDASLLIDPGIPLVLRATFAQAALSTTISAIAGLALGLWIGSLGPGRVRLPQALLAVPYGVPTLVVAAAWIAFLGRSGLLAGAGIRLDWLYSLKAVVLAHAFLNIPWVALLVSQARAAVSHQCLEAASTMGAGPVARLREIVWPEVRAAWASACAQVFALCAMSFVLVLLLGGGPPVETLETAIYSRVRLGPLDVPGAAVCALGELLITLTPWLLVLLWQRRAGGVARSERAEAGRARPRAGRAASAAGALVAALFLLPYLVVLAGHPLIVVLEPGTRAEVLDALRISFRIAATASLGALFLALAGVLAGKTGRFASGLILALPAGISTLVLALGIWLAYSSWIDPFSGSWLAIAGVQVVLFTPLAFRILWPVAQTSERRLLEAAATLGASPWQAFRAIEWPRWKGPAFSALALVAGASLGEVAAISFFSGSRLVPLPLLISRWMAQYRFEEAQSACALLFLISFLIIGAIAFFGNRNDELAAGVYDRPAR